MLCPWPYFATNICTAGKDVTKSCAGKHHSLQCTKFKDTLIDGHNSYFVLDSEPDNTGETQKCPSNYALVGFCSSDEQNHCDGHSFSITCAPIKFKECINVDDLLNSEIDLQYRAVFEISWKLKIYISVEINRIISKWFRI